MLDSGRKEMISYGCIFMAIILGLYSSSLFSYPLFHSLIEITTISIAFTLFILAWNTRRFLNNDCLKFICIGYAFIAAIDLLHTLTYKGMNVFPGYGANLPTQLWIAARFIQAAILCIAPVFARRRISEYFLCGANFAAVSMIVVLVFSGNFPDCYVEGKGLTLFKVIAEYAISAMLVFSLILFHRVRTSFKDMVYILIITSIACTVVSELSFSAYFSVYGFANMLGHLLKLAAFYLIYRALLVTGLKEPFDLIFRDLKQTEEALRIAHDTLEKKVCERTAELSASEEKYRALIESANDAVFIHEITEDDMPGPFLQVNEVACRLLGYSREELARMSPIELDDSHCRDRITLSMGRLLKDGHAVFETTQIAKDGRSIPVEVSTRLLELRGTRFIISLVRDITERKRMEKVLRESEELFRTLTEKSFVGVYIIQDGLFRYVNPAFVELSGYASEEIIDRLGPADLLTPEDRDRVLDSIRRRTVGEIEFTHHEFHITRKDGSIRIVEAFGSRALHQGRTSILGTIIDVTERKRSEERLFQVTERWKRTFDAVPDLIAIIDTDFRIVQANKAMADRLGVTPAECAGQVCYAVIHKTEAPPSFCPHTRTLADCREHTAEVSVESLGGDFIVTTSPVYDSAEKLIGSVHVAHDITERRKAEEERKLLAAQLYQSQKMEAIGQLAGGIAHDFNNMLTAIMGYTEIILRRMEKDSPLRYFVEQVLTVTDSAAELTRGLLTFSRRQVLHAKPMDLCGIVLGFEKLQRRLLPKDIDFTTTVAGGNLIVMADKGQIEQVLVNLVNNAKDAMPRGGSLAIEVSPAIMNERFVHAHGFGEAGNYGCVSVTDTGLGMDEETRKRIFEPFYTTKEVGKGTGLGMAIVFGIIQQHDGCITVSSEIGRGTTFRIFLPLINEEINETHWALEAGAPSGGTEIILLVEDEVTVRETYKMILEEAGYRVIEAFDGEDALDRFMEHRSEVDFVVSDVIMPNIDGKALCEKIRKIRPDMKVLFMSGYTKENLAERGILVDETGFMTKPVKPFELLKTVREMLDQN